MLQDDLTLSDEVMRKGDHFKILLVNDDGFVTRALPLTYEILKEFGEVLAVVPETPKSGGGHSLTLHKPLFLRELGIYGLRVFAINGTPVDAFYAAKDILGFNPDLIVSGINIGENTSSQNILYSGTVEAAIEAGLFGYPSIALSADVMTDEEFENPKYSFMVRKVVEALVEYVKDNGWFDGVDTLSVNLPRTTAPKGVVMPKTQRIRFIQRFERRIDPRGREYYWLVGERVVEEGTDSYYLSNGYVTITPLVADLTHPAIGGCRELTEKINDLLRHIEKALESI